MSRFKVKRSYRQLMAERNAIKQMIESKMKTYLTEIRAQINGESNAYTLVKLVNEIESDKALLAEIERDLDAARKRRDRLLVNAICSYYRP